MTGALLSRKSFLSEGRGDLKIDCSLFTTHIVEISSNF